MKILVFGKTGQVATELARYKGVTTLGRDQVDLTDLAAVRAAVDDAEADIIINAAAYTAVDGAEADAETAEQVNHHAVAAMADRAAKRGIPLLHISTDYVFPGGGDAPWTPESDTGPLGVYGRTKLNGEAAVRAAGGSHVILRTSWVFSAHGANFVKTMLRLGAERDALGIVTDQVGGPTAARDIAQALITIGTALAADPGLSGTYHFAGAPDVSWADFAREIFRRAELPTRVDPITTADYPTPATRPLNSRLDCTATEKAFAVARPDWRVGLQAVLEDLKGRT